MRKSSAAKVLKIEKSEKRVKKKRGLPQKTIWRPEFTNWRQKGKKVVGGPGKTTYQKVWFPNH